MLDLAADLAAWRNTSRAEKCALHSNTCILVRAVCELAVLIRVQRELMSGVSRRFPDACSWRYYPGVLIGSSAQANVWGSPPFAQRELCGWRYSPGVLIGSTAQAEVWVHRRLPSASIVAGATVLVC